MKITLENFGIHTSSEFILQDKGLVLLSGNNGSGKSTIFQAIVYALYGESTRAITPHQLKTKKKDPTSKVSLEIRGLRIERTFKPTSLTVDVLDVSPIQTYKDNTAQQYINKVMGLTYQEFILSSYIEPDERKFILRMTPSEQLSFIQRLAFENDVHLEYREKFKEYVGLCASGVSEIQGQLALLRSQLSKKKEILGNSEPIPEKYKDPEVFEKAMNEMAELRMTIREKNNKLRLLREEYNQIQSIIKDRTKCEIEIQQYTSLIDDLGDILSEEEIGNIQSKIEDLSTELSTINVYNKYKEQINILEKMEKDHLASLKEQLKKYKKKDTEDIVKKYDEATKSYTEYLEAISKREKLENNFQRYKKIEKTILDSAKTLGIECVPPQKTRGRGRARKVIASTPDDIITFVQKNVDKHIKLADEEMNEITKKMLSLEKQDDVKYTCPLCDVELVIIDDALTQFDPKEHVEDVVKEINKTKKAREVLRDRIKDLNRLAGLFVTLEEYKSDYILYNNLPEIPSFDLEGYNKLEKSFNDNKNRIELERQYTEKIYPSSIIELRKRTEQLQPSTIPKRDAAIVSKKLNTLKENLATERKRIVDYSTYRNAIKKRKETIKELEMRLPKTDVRGGDITEIIEKLEVEINEYQEKYEGMEHLRDLEKVFRVQEEIKELELSLEETIDAEEKAVKEHSGALALQKAGKDAEIVALSSTLRAINEYAGLYLEKLFTEPILVKLDCEKKNASGNAPKKLSMNTQLIYRGASYNSIKEMSTGEKQRADMAFLLGINDMVGSRIIILDECLSYIDAEFHSEVLSMLREISKEKLIIVVSHESMTGVFDQIVKM